MIQEDGLSSLSGSTLLNLPIRICLADTDDVVRRANEVIADLDMMVAERLGYPETRANVIVRAVNGRLPWYNGPIPIGLIHGREWILPADDVERAFNEHMGPVPELDGKPAEIAAALWAAHAIDARLLCITNDGVAVILSGSRILLAPSVRFLRVVEAAPAAQRAQTPESTANGLPMVHVAVEWEVADDNYRWTRYYTQPTTDDDDDVAMEGELDPDPKQVHQWKWTVYHPYVWEMEEYRITHGRAGDIAGALAAAEKALREVYDVRFVQKGPAR